MMGNYRVRFQGEGAPATVLPLPGDAEWIADLLRHGLLRHPRGRRMGRTAGYMHPARAQLESGKGATLPPLPPLRTVQASFPAYGSSLPGRPCDRTRHRYGVRLGVDLPVAGGVEQHQVRCRVASAFRAPDNVVHVRLTIGND